MVYRYDILLYINKYYEFINIDLVVRTFKIRF